MRGRETKESTMRDFEKGETGVNEWGERMFIRVWLGFIWYTRQKASYAKCSINGVHLHVYVYHLSFGNIYQSSFGKD